MRSLIVNLAATILFSGMFSSMLMPDRDTEITYTLEVLSL